MLPLHSAVPLLHRSSALAHRLASLLAVWLLLSFGSAAATAQCATDLQSAVPIPAMRGQAVCTVPWDPDGAGPLPTWLVVGGNNLTGGDQISPVGLLAFDGAQWRDLGFGARGVVFALAVFQGDLVVAGNFVLPTAAGNAVNIMRRSGSTWLPLGHGFSGFVRAMTVFAGELVVGGGFSSAGGINAPIARWNGTAWSSLGSVLTSGTVLALATFGSLYVGGDFQTSVGHSLLRWNGTTWSAAGNPTLGGSRFEVSALRGFTGTTQGSSFLIAAGRFDSIGGVAVNGVARAGTGATTWTAMGTPPAGLSIKDLTVIPQFLGSPLIYAVGHNTSTARATQWTGTSWVTLGNLGPAGASATAHGLLNFGGALAATIETAPTTPAFAVYRFTTDWGPFEGRGFPSPVRCLTFDGPDAIAGGAFATADGVLVRGIARRQGTAWGPLGSGMTGGAATVLAVARAPNGDVFAGGDFTAAGGNAANHVARWNGSTWAPLGAGMNGAVRALLVAGNGDLLAGGDFTSAGGVACNRIARWNGTAWSPLGSGMDASVRCLAQRPNGDLVAGGSFTVAGGVPCLRVANWNGVAWSPIDVGMNDAVRALVVRPDGVLVAGGAFTTVGGSRAALRAAFFDGTLWQPLGAGVPGTVHALAALPNGDVLLGGPFADIGINHLARHDRAANTVAGLPGGGLFGVEVSALAAAPNGDVLIGGDFDTVLLPQAAGLLAAGHLALYTTNCPASASVVPTACVGPAGPVVLTADTLPWVGTTFRSSATGFAPLALAVAAFGLTPANVPLVQLHPTGLPNCDLLSAADSLQVVFPTAGVSHHDLVVPNSPVLAGFPLSHQCLQVVFNAGGGLQSISSSNALALVVGHL